MWPRLVLFSLLLFYGFINSCAVHSEQIIKSTLIHQLPTEFQKYATQEEEFLELFNTLADTPLDLLFLVDHAHVLPKTYVPKNLVNLDNYSHQLFVGRKGLLLSALAIPDLINMTKAASAQDIRLLVSSTYRSFSYQKALYARIVRSEGYAQASREVAPPGSSQHQLGTAIDFGSISADFDNTSASKWLAKNAWKFGFTLSYPQGYQWLTGYKYESWHYRYVGKDAAAFIHRYFDDIQHYFLVYWLYNGQRRL